MKQYFKKKNKIKKASGVQQQPACSGKKVPGTQLVSGY